MARDTLSDRFSVVFVVDAHGHQAKIATDLVAQAVKDLFGLRGGRHAHEYGATAPGRRKQLLVTRTRASCRLLTTREREHQSPSKAEQLPSR
jgi:hypothetical protein